MSVLSAPSSSSPLPQALFIVILISCSTIDQQREFPEEQFLFCNLSASLLAMSAHYSLPFTSANFSSSVFTFSFFAAFRNFSVRGKRKADRSQLSRPWSPFFSALSVRTVKSVFFDSRTTLSHRNPGFRHPHALRLT